MGLSVYGIYTAQLKKYTGFAQDGVSTDCTWLRNTIWWELALLTSLNSFQQIKTFNIGLHITVFWKGAVKQSWLCMHQLCDEFGKEVTSAARWTY